MKIEDRPTPKTDAGRVSRAFIEREMNYEHKFILADHCRRIEQERDHALEVLRAIANPIAAMQKAVPKGHLFNGAMAVQIAADPAYYQGIAQDALDEIKG